MKVGAGKGTMVSFRGNSIHAPSRDPSVLPSEARVTCGAALSWRGSPEVRAADGSIISARVSHSHACDLRAYPLG